MKVAEKLGVTQKEIDKLCDSITTALENGPLARTDCERPQAKPSGISVPRGKRRA
jgi:hypothetical protein